MTDEQLADLRARIVNEVWAEIEFSEKHLSKLRKEHVENAIARGPVPALLDEVVRAAVEAEREECAKVADGLSEVAYVKGVLGFIIAEGIAAAIRARGETK